MLDQKALDVIRALQREGEPSLLDRVIKLYLDSSPKLLRSLRESVEQKDNLKAVHEAAHSLKSSSANLGATALATLCKELEEMARQDRMTGAEKKLGEIEETYKTVCRLLVAESEKAVA